MIKTGTEKSQKHYQCNNIDAAINVTNAKIKFFQPILT